MFVQIILHFISLFLVNGFVLFNSLFSLLFSSLFSLLIPCQAFSQPEVIISSIDLFSSGKGDNKKVCCSPGSRKRGFSFFSLFSLSLSFLKIEVRHFKKILRMFVRAMTLFLEKEREEAKGNYKKRRKKKKINK